MNNQVILSEPIQESVIQQKTDQIDEQELKTTCDWFVLAHLNDGTTHSYKQEQFIPELKNSIICGTVHLEDTLDVCAKTENGSWAESKTTLGSIVNENFNLRILYQPVWAHAMAGLKWGAIIGIGIKVLDTLILFGMIDPILIFFFLTALALFFFPRYGFMAAAILAFTFIRSAGFDAFFSAMTTTLAAAFTASLTGAILGCLPGMFIGGMVGVFRRNILPAANDISTEPDHLILKAVVLPLIGGTALLSFYLLIFNPWLIKILSQL